MQQMTGINIVTYYAPTLYKTGLGMSEEKALLLGGFTQIWYVLASFVTWYTIDRVGRRKLLISMAIGMALVLTGEALATAANSHLGSIMAVVCIFLFESCFTWGWMIRAKGSALATAADFIGNWILVEVTPAVDLVFTGQTDRVTAADSDSWSGRLQWDRVKVAQEAVRATRGRREPQERHGERQALLLSS
ncbi:hypothetical protein QBC40DRAFT_334610 [Triangularia verruculosa]|uniref:Major facilitator superfamily (MFS) profile domain-containing protein n=1 Tax=Triangularia verruculosa TaxID=2587418 RepID=A0AAN7ASJ4_9PEZI|nr:hypothetical protein QBC40DRAFT_334610 [Triangularia verruculosa]